MGHFRPSCHLRWSPESATSCREFGDFTPTHRRTTRRVFSLLGRAETDARHLRRGAGRLVAGERRRQGDAGRRYPPPRILRRVIKLPLLAVFVGVVTTGILAIGYLFNFLIA